MQVVIIGTGNTAHILGRLIRRAGHRVLTVMGRNADQTRALAGILDARPASLHSEIAEDATLILLAVADQALEEVARSVRLKKGMIVHTAGTVSKEILKDSSANYGVLYPLQSLRKESTELPMIPLLVDGNTAEDQTLLMDFAASLSTQVQLANDEQRRHLHLSAVVVNNFPNYLYAKASDYCRLHGVDFNLLLPLIQQTSSRLFTQSPADTQTGPAIRGDQKTIEKHLLMLESDPELKNLYLLFTQYIQAYFNK
jgi:predicted short-subunit dehydrogenase-like oxidoreductase (DUF2520 family)